MKQAVGSVTTESGRASGPHQTPPFYVTLQTFPASPRTGFCIIAFIVKGASFPMTRCISFEKNGTLCHWRLRHKFHSCSYFVFVISLGLTSYFLFSILLLFSVYGGHALITKHFLVGYFTHLGFRVGRFCDLQSLTLHHQLRAFGDSAGFLMGASVDTFHIFTVGNDEK